MSVARTSSSRATISAPRLRLVEDAPAPRRQRFVRRGPHPVVTATVVIVTLVAAAVGFAAQQVAGQSHLDTTRDGIVEARQDQQELRAAVAEAESPARVLDAARDLGMIEPAPALAVPAPLAEEGVDRG